VNRGGSFNNAASNARSANRNNNTPENRNNNLGLRPAKASHRPIAPALSARRARDAQIRFPCRASLGARPNSSFDALVAHRVEVDGPVLAFETSARPRHARRAIGCSKSDDPGRASAPITPPSKPNPPLPAATAPTRRARSGAGASRVSPPARG